MYWYDANNRLTNVLNGPGGASIIGLGYDVRGNVNNKNGNLFVFDHGNRLRTAQGTDTYRYDAQGRRVRTAGADGLLYEMYSLDGKLLWQRDEPLGLRFQHIYLGGSLVASRRMPIGQTTFSTIYRHTDALGSPIAATDELGNTLQTTEHEPYGKMLNRTNDNRPGYTGHMMDKATGLVYMQQRYYDPLIPRFLSVDPITAYSNPVGAFNRYWYANNNPYRFTDPDGRDGVDRRYGQAVGFRLRNDPERLRVWSAGEAAATTEGSFAEQGAAEGISAGQFIDRGDYSAHAVGTAILKAAIGAVLTGRGKNRLSPDSAAKGAHSSMKRDANGKITNTATYEPNPKKPIWISRG